MRASRFVADWVGTSRLKLSLVCTSFALSSVCAGLSATFVLLRVWVALFILSAALGALGFNSLLPPPVLLPSLIIPPREGRTVPVFCRGVLVIPELP